MKFGSNLAWIADRLSRPNYRGCPQINVAAEFAETTIQHARWLQITNER